MRRIRITFIAICIFMNVFQHARADDIDFQRVLSAAQENCIGIHDRLVKVRNMAGINTAVTGVGTLAAGGALYAGISKNKLDKQVEELEKQLENLENMSDSKFLSFLKQMAAYEDNLAIYQTICAQKKNLEKKSKQLGNIRTGLMAGNTATAIAGTVIANKNKNDSKTIAEHISACLKTIDDLTFVMGQAQASGENEKYQKLRQIYDACNKMYTKNLEKISNNSNAAMISSAVNIGTGTAGTITSAVANTNAIRRDNSESGKKKEKNLNTAANILAGLSTGASGVATVFNALTLKAVNDNLNAAQECEEALQ